MDTRIIAYNLPFRTSELCGNKKLISRSSPSTFLFLRQPIIYKLPRRSIIIFLSYFCITYLSINVSNFILSLCCHCTIVLIVLTFHTFSEIVLMRLVITIRWLTYGRKQGNIFFRNKSLGRKTNKQTEKKFLCLSQRLAQTFFEAKYLDFILKSLFRYKKVFIWRVAWLLIGRFYDTDTSSVWCSHFKNKLYVLSWNANPKRQRWKSIDFQVKFTTKAVVNSL